MSTAQQGVGRRRGSGRKGDSREQSILDAAEELLASDGFDAMTVEAIARGAGISRGSLYFYFGSKQEVLTALVARTMTAIRSSHQASLDADQAPRDVVVGAIEATEGLWREHGVVMQAAIDVGHSIPAVGAAWSETLERSVVTFGDVLARASTGTTDPAEASSLARALCYMVERSFYWSYASSGPEHLHDVSLTCQKVWLATLETLER